MIFPGRRVGIVGFCLVLFFSLISFLSFPLQASALTPQEVNAATYSFINRATITMRVGSETLTFKDVDIGDIEFEYELQNPAASCMTEGNAGLIRFDFSGSINRTPDFSTAEIDFDYVDSSSSQSSCVDSGGFESINVGNQPNFAYAYGLIAEDTIIRVDGNDDWEFVQHPTFSELFLRSSEQGEECQDVIVVNANQTTFRLYQLDKDGTSPAPPQTRASGCNMAPSPSPEATASASNDNLLQALSESGTIGGQGATTGENEPSCESEGADLSWILCPILYTGDAVIRKLDQALIGLLSVSEDYYTNNKLETAWARMRNIAYIILVPIVLVMVISTALGFEFVSAYTVKRALPRLIAATLFIALSFEISKFLVVLANDVGRGIYGLVIGAFAGADEISLATIFSPNNSDSLVGLAFGSAALTGALAVGSIGIILSYLFIGIVGLAIGFFLLSFRQMLLIALMLVAPLAILAWIFPGNDKLWKLWWGTFSKLLLLFPLIMLLIAVGKSFARLVAETDGSLVSTLLKLVAYVGPYFLIPATFKFAGGTFATIAGIANDRGRGLFDRNKKYRQEKMGQNWQKTRAGNRFGAEHGRLNRTLQRVSRPDSILPGRFGAKGRSVNSTLVSAQANQGAKALQDLGLLDDAAGNEFIQHGTSLGSLNKRVSELRASGQSSLADQLSSYAQFAGNRQMLLGAMKLNAGFGKLADGSLKQLDTIFGDTPGDRAAKQAAFGDLIFTSKGAGNYATYAARIKDNKVMTMSDAEFAGSEGATNMAKAMMDAGPNVLSNIKPYTDKTSGDGYNTKELTAKAIVMNAVNAPDASGRRRLSIEEHARAMENFVSAEMEGAYNDPNMKAAFDRAMGSIQSNPEALRMYNEARATLMSRRGGDDLGRRKAAGLED